jgi:site-specific recombinase XerD
MKKLRLKNSSYKVLVTNYREWLDILGFAESTVYLFPNYLQEFFYYLEQRNINTVDHISREIIKEYYTYLSERPNERRHGALSKSYLNSHQQALKKFKEYLQKHTNKSFPLHLKPERINRLDIINILSQQEVKELFKATEFSSVFERVQLRDKAMLVLLYSCGLRRNEAVNVNIKDILFDKELLLVRKGKNYKERFVPINYYNIEILENYIYEARIQFKDYNQSEALLIGNYGTRLKGNTLAGRLQEVIKATNNEEIIAKK